MTRERKKPPHKHTYTQSRFDTGFTSTSPSHGKTKTDNWGRGEKTPKPGNLKGQTPVHKGRRGNEKCCRRRVGGTDLCSQNRAEREQEREAPPSWGWLQPSPTSARRRKKLLPSVCITGRRQREDAGGRGVTIGIPKPDLAECRVNSTPPRSCPNVPQSHTDFEVLNTARHTSPKMGGVGGQPGLAET